MKQGKKRIFSVNIVCDDGTFFTVTYSDKTISSFVEKVCRFWEYERTAEVMENLAQFASVNSDKYFFDVIQKFKEKL